MFGGIRWLLTAFGTQSVEVYEWSESNIRKKRLKNGPVWKNLTTQRPNLQFNGWQLAQAVVKADYLIDRNFFLPGLGFILQLDQIVNFSSGSNLRLVDGAPATLNDFTRTSLSGRMAQGLSLLFAQQRGFHFAGHLASDPAVKQHLASGTAATERAADFLFETSSKTRMILESKGTFSQIDNDPSRIKSILRSALTGQVDYWMDKITPKASKGYAVYSCLREVSGATPSAIVFVDPPEKPVSNPIELPESWVKRRNYAAWLRVMGFEEAAARLRFSGSDIRVATPLFVVAIEGKQFAVTGFFAQAGSRCRLCAGLDIKVMKAISKSLEGDDSDLMALEHVETDGVRDFETDRDWSIFPDGSFFGLVDLTKVSVSVETFQL